MPFRPTKSRPGHLSRRQRPSTWHLAALASASLLSLTTLQANTVVDVLNGTTDLTTLGAGPTNDLRFTTATTYNPTDFTANSALNIGTLNDLDGTQTLSISGTGTITLNGGTNSVSGTAADLLYVVGGGTLNVSNNIALTTATASGNFNVAGTSTLSGIISGAGFGFTKTGNGTLTLSGANTFSGGSALNAGTLKLGSSSVGTAGTVGSNGALTSGALGTGSLNINGGAILDLNGQTFGNRFVISANNSTVTNSSASLATVTGALDGSLNGNNISSFTVGGTGDIRWNGQISRTNGTLGLTKNGNNTVTFVQAANNAGIGTLLINSGTVGLGVTGTSSGAFSDSVTVAGGTLKFRPDLGTVSGGNTFGGQINSTITLNSGTVDLNGSSGQNSRVQQLIGTGGTVTNTSATAATLGISARDTNTTREFDGLIKDGTGTVALDFSNQGTTGSGRINFLTGANTYSGGTSISFGTVRLGSSSALGTGLVTLSNGNGGTLDLFGQTFANGLATGGNNAVITNSSATTATVSSGFNQAGAGGVVISDFTINGTGDINWTGAIRRTNFNGTVNKSGTNTLTLAGAGGDYSNFAYNVSAGTLAFKLTGGTFNSGNITNNAAIVGAAVSGVTNTIANPISGTGTFTQTGAGTTILTAANTYTGATTINAGGTLQLDNGGNTGALAAGGTITNNGTFAINRSGTATQGTDFSTAAISGTGGFTQAGSGVTIFNVANTYSGVTTINAGTLRTSNTGSAIAASSATVIASGGTLDVNGNGSEVVNNLSGAGTITSSFSQQFSGVNLVNNTNTTFSGVLDGGLGSGGAVTKLGTSTLTLTGTSTYGGATNVSAGTLLVNGGLSGAGAVTVATGNGATLGGSGTIAGTATINGTVAPGGAAGAIGMLTLTSAAGATISNTGVFLVDIGGTTSDNLRLSAGALTITTGATLTFNVFSTLTAASYNLANYTTETGAFTVTNLPAGYTLNYGTGELDLVATAVPEPSTWAAGLLCLGALGYRLRRRFTGRTAA